LGIIECLEGGKSISVVDDEIQASIDLWEYAATLARHMYGDTYDQLGDETMGLVFREPPNLKSWSKLRRKFYLADGLCYREQSVRPQSSGVGEGPRQPGAL
jgi:hypothetical protein